MEADETCKCCMTAQASKFCAVGETLKVLFRDFIQEFELNDGFLCLSCSGCLQNFGKFKSNILETHRRFNQSFSFKSSTNFDESLKTDTLEPEVVIKMEMAENHFDEEATPQLPVESSKSSKIQLHPHLFLTPSNLFDDETKKSPPPELICEICSAEFDNRKDFFKHKRIHSTKKSRVPCDSCPQTFPNKKALIVHQNQKHPDRGEFTCVNCFSIFSTLDLMKQHQRNTKCYNYEKRKKIQKKYDDERLLCTLCGKMVLKIQLKTHVSVIHNKERNHQCAECGKSYTNATGLRHHRLSKHSNGKQFSCAHCDQKFTNKYTLQRHLRHTHFLEGFSKIRCQLCLKGFKRPYALDRHMKQVHFPAEPDDGLKVNVETNNFHCPHCDSQFVRKVSCQQHILKFHK